MKKLFPFIFLLCLFHAAASADERHDKDIEVKVAIDGEDVIIDVAFSVQVTPQKAWEVLTDFDHMAEFVSNLQFSKIIDSSKNTLYVSQKGVAKHALITFPFESVREIRLTPVEKIRSRLLSGSMRKLEGMTRLFPEGDHTRITYHSDTFPGVWIPPIVGKSFIEHETREQFQEMRDEMLRRKQLNVN